MLYNIFPFMCIFNKVILIIWVLSWQTDLNSQWYEKHNWFALGIIHFDNWHFVFIKFYFVIFYIDPMISKHVCVVWASDIGFQALQQTCCFDWPLVRYFEVIGGNIQCILNQPRKKLTFSIVAFKWWKTDKMSQFSPKRLKEKDVRL